MSKKTQSLKSEKILVAVPGLLMEKLNEDKEKRGYASVQVIINEAIRERYFGFRNVALISKIAHKSYKGERRGRKPAFDHVKMVTGENVLVK